MKKLILGMAVVTTLVACNEKGSNPSTPALNKEGGISSGGGGTLPADPANVWQIQDIVKDAKRDLRLYFRNEKFHAQYDKTVSELDKKLFLQKYSLVEALEKTDLELLKDRPCYDANGKEVDGSIHSGKPNTICISAFRIAPKVAKELARTEVTALIAHELSHIVGATEDEAAEFQKNTVFVFKHFKVEEHTSEYMVDEFYQKTANTYYGIKDIIENYDKLSDLDLGKKLQEVVMSLSGAEEKTMVLPFSFYLKPEYDYKSIQSTRIRVALWYVHGLTQDAGGNYWKEQLDKVYGLDSELSHDEFDKRHFDTGEPTFGPNSWPNETIKRVNSREEVLVVLKQLKDYYYDQMNYSWKFKFSAPLAKLTVGPWVKAETNSWEKFAGEYAVTDRQCQVDGYQKDILKHRTGFIVFYDAGYEKMMLRELTNGGFGTSALYDNGAAFSASATVSIVGDASSATRVSESGQTWAGDWQKSVETLEQTLSGYIWKARIDSKSEIGKKHSFADCTLTLEKK